MEHPEGFEFQESRNDDYAQSLTDVFASHSLSGFFLNPWATTFDTAASSHPFFQPSLFTTHFLEPPADNAAWSDPINFITSGYPSIPPFHTPVPSEPPEHFGQLPYNSHLHDPPSVTPLGHPHPPFVLPSQYTGCDPSSHSQAQSSTYFQYPSLRHLPYGGSIDHVANSSPHAASSIPSMASRHSLYRPPTEQPYHRIRHRQQRGGFLNGARDFVIKNAVMNDNSNSANLMLELLKTTIPGAEFDCSDRDPPPQCHPGTRLSIINRTQCFITKCGGKRKMRWIVGPAGVGKSAIMQTLAEKTSATIANVVLGASIFFSVKGRNDAAKAITTLAYQLAVNYVPYRQIIEEKIAHNPSLLGKSMTVQFNKFIVEPFIQQLPNSHHRRFLILIDGLDECESYDTQCALIGLISYFCITYPTSPLIWIIASRPEPHITSFFSRPKVRPAYEKEEIPVDSDEARKDVERFLRDELRKIQMKSFALRDRPQWPTEHDFLKLADASSGMFACASTIVRYIDDPAYANPASQLCEVLEVIDSNSRHHVDGKPHPMAHLDALYTRIMSRVPADVMVDTRKLLLAMMERNCTNLCLMCNWLGMTKDTAYSATYHLRSVLHVPEPWAVSVRNLSAHHKSFTDYLWSFERSQFCPDIDDASCELVASCARRVLEEAPNGVLIGDPSTYANISVSWPSQVTDDGTQLDLYQISTEEITFGLRYNQRVFLKPLFVHALTIIHEKYFDDFLISRCLFDKSRRSTFMEHKVLKQMQIRTLDPRNTTLDPRNIRKDIQVRYRFQCPAATMHQIPDPPDPLCKHYRDGSYDEGQDQDWETFIYTDKPCSCSTRFFQHLEIGKTRSPDDLVTVFINFRLCGFVEYRFIDPGGSMAEWTYFIPYNFPSPTGMQSCSISATSEQCDLCSE